MRRTVVFSAVVLVAVLGSQPSAANNRPSLVSEQNIAAITKQNSGYLVGFSIDPNTSMVRIINTGRDAINDLFDVQAVTCIDCGPPCVAPAVRTIQIDLVANADIAAGYGASALTSVNFTVTGVQYSTQGALSTGSPLIITITGNVLDCGDWFNVFFDICDTAPAQWDDPCPAGSSVCISSDSLLLNGCFDSNLDGWDTIPPWSHDPVRGHDTSGSAALTYSGYSGIPTLEQCVPVGAGSFLHASAWFRITNQVAPATKCALFSDSYSTADCTGVPIRRIESVVKNPPVDVWIELAGVSDSTTSAGTQSANCSVICYGNFGDITSIYDDIYFGTVPPPTP